MKRELVEHETGKGNTLQSDLRRITHGYQVTLKDRLPVPRHEGIKLRVLDIKP